MLLPNNIHPSWNGFLTEDVLNELKEIEHKIGSNYNPRPSNRVLRFMTIDLSKVVVICLGMDAYPSKDTGYVNKEALLKDASELQNFEIHNYNNGDMVEVSLSGTGRSFEVGSLMDWNDKFRQVSLKNIVRLLYKNYNDIDDYEDIKKFSDIQKEIKSGDFNILPPNKIFDSWEKQGVLCMNIYPTCEIGKPGSHKDIWHDFSVRLLNYISKTNPNISWFLWGKEAVAHKEYILDGKIVESRHPMMCSAKYEDDFLKSSCFKDTMDKINWLGL